MNNNTSSSAAPTTNADNAAVRAEAARIRAGLESDTANAATPAIGPVIEPVVVSCRVSTHMEADPGRGSYSVQLAVEDATITTSAALEHCTALSLRIAAHDAARRILAVQLCLARAGRQITSDYPCEPKKRSKSKRVAPEQPMVHRDSFWVSQARTEGAPDFEPTAWNTISELASSAAFAEFAFHQID